MGPGISDVSKAPQDGFKHVEHAPTVSEWYHHAVAMTLRTDPELETALTALAEAEGASRQEVIRRAVLDRYERRGHRARVEAGSERMLNRWGDVLDRLGRA